MSVDPTNPPETRNLATRSFKTSSGLRTFNFGHEPPITKRDFGGQFNVKQAVSSPENLEQIERRFKLDLCSDWVPSGVSTFKTLESRISYAGEHS